MSKFNTCLDVFTWLATFINIWIYRRRTRERKARRRAMLRYRDAEVRALLERLDEIARGKP